MRDYKPLTNKQLGDVVDQYASMFPDWQVFGRVGFFRTRGPVRQQIGFEALRTGAYRPAHTIVALPLPTSGMLHQDLDIRNRQIYLRHHASRWLDVVAAMEAQFRPDVRKPLDLEEVTDLCEHQARNSTNDLAMLAILYAWLGRKIEAIHCCEKMADAPMPTLAPVPEWQRDRIAFGQELVRQIHAGTDRQFLDAASAHPEGWSPPVE